jgi:hypothetical protein
MTNLKHTPAEAILVAIDVSPMRMSASWFGSWTHRIQGRGAIVIRARKAGSPLIVIPTALSVPSCVQLYERTT